MCIRVDLALNILLRSTALHPLSTFSTLLASLTLGACARVTVVILCVCYRPSADIRRVCDKIGLPVYSSLHAKGFKLSVFAKKPSISSSSLFSLRTAERAAILKH